LIDPKFLSAFSASLCSKFGGELRGTGMAEATIKKHLATLKAFLNWCNKLGGLRVMPQILLPKRVNKMRGRAITLEEFERYRETIRTATVSKCNRLGTQRKPLSKLIPDHLQDEIIRLVDGLWLSGLRLDEALELGWDTGEIRIIIAQDKPPRLKIEANADKSTESRILPLAPDFGEFLLQTPVGKRRGRVFRPVVPGQIGEMRLDTMSKVLERIGHRAGILEYEKPPKKGSKVTQKKWASAHSFRRAFGTRHAKYLSPLELMILMRHKNIKTTMDFYLDANAETVETAIAAKSPNKTPNIETKSAFPNARKG
jgi:integrase